MSDPELEAIRARRMAELQQQHGKPGGQQKAVQERKEKEEDIRNTILSQILSQEARARLSNITLAKPDRGKMLENILITNAQRGAFRSK
ncbi:PREDICTED: programmed cell death protein 5-like, partial [Rhagoletis zephyria]|uniref:programmed cell death protein 5-like n=1 Tax=Rhagoletis zephyria TaxID=28612 RepID=UPI00081135DE